MARSSRHWYVLGGNGRIQENHGLGIKDARKARACISPTTVTSEVRATPYNLNKWMRKQLAEACSDAPRQVYPDGSVEDLDFYYERVNDLSFRKSDVATKFGTRIHSVVEQYPAKQIDPQLEPWYDQLKIWHENHVAEDMAKEERVMDMDIGVAGTLDRRYTDKRTNELSIADFKTQGIKEKVYVGESWGKQLACYANAIRKKFSLPFNPKCVSVIIDSTAPNPFITEEWSAEEINEAYRDFVCELYLWSKDHKHWPRGVWNLADVLNNPYLCPR